MSPPLPFVTVALATSNRAASLARTLDSLRRQDYPPDRLEIVVVDDGSTDNTREVVEARIDAFHPAALVYAGIPKGNVAQARTRGVELARGELVALTDDDCTFPASWLRTLVEAFNDPAVAAAGGGDHAPAVRTPFGGAVDYAFSGFLGTGCVRRGDARTSMARFFPRGCNMAVRRRVLTEVGAFDPRFYNGEEIDLDYRIARAGYRLVFREGCEVTHHRRATWRGLVRQVFGRGHTRVLLFREHPEFFEAAYAAPLAALAVAAAVAVGAMFSAWASVALLAGLLLYAGALAAGALHCGLTRHRPGEAFYVPPVVAVVHAAYAIGMLAGLCSRYQRPRRAAGGLRVLISNDGYGLNLGDRAILQIMLSDLRERFPGVQLRGFLNSWLPGPGALAGLWRDLRWADVFVLGGGQVLHDQTCLCFLLAALLKLQAARLARTPFVCYGIGAGPIRSRVGRALVRRTLRHGALLIVRDGASKQLLQDVGVRRPPITVTADPAFRLQPLEPAAGGALLAEAGIAAAARPRIAICPRRWFHYTHSLLPVRWRLRTGRRLQGRERFSALLDALAAAADRVMEQGGTVVLVPMKAAARPNDPGQDDDLVCRELRGRLRRPEGACLVPGDTGPAAIAAILAEMDGVLTMRMHAAILALSRGVPTLGISLSDKFDDLFGVLDIRDWLIPVDDAGAARLADMLDGLLRTDAALRAELRERAAALAVRSGETIRHFEDWIRKAVDP